MPDLQRILLIEEQKKVASIVRILEQEGIQYDHATNFREALLAMEGVGYAGLDAYGALVINADLPKGIGSDIAITVLEEKYGFEFEGTIVMLCGSELSEATARGEIGQRDNVTYLQKEKIETQLIPLLTKENPGYTP